MDADVTLDAARVIAPPLPIEALSGHLTIDNGLAKLQPLHLQAAGGRIEPAGQIPLSAGSAAPIDVAIVQVQSLQSVGRVGTYPNGRNGLSMSTTACNVGSDNIPWFAPMNVAHPVIAMNLYRSRDRGDAERARLEPYAGSLCRRRAGN